MREVDRTDAANRRKRAPVNIALQESFGLQRVKQPVDGGLGQGQQIIRSSGRDRCAHLRQFLQQQQQSQIGRDCLVARAGVVMHEGRCPVSLAQTVRR